MTQSVVANNALVALSNSFTTAPNFWVSPQGVTYNVATQTPQYRMASYSALQGMPVIGAGRERRSRSSWTISRRFPAIPARTSHRSTTSSTSSTSTPVRRTAIWAASPGMSIAS